MPFVMHGMEVCPEQNVIPNLFVGSKKEVEQGQVALSGLIKLQVQDGELYISKSFTQYSNYLETCLDMEEDDPHALLPTINLSDTTFTPKILIELFAVISSSKHKVPRSLLQHVFYAAEYLQCTEQITQKLVAQMHKHNLLYDDCLVTNPLSLQQKGAKIHIVNEELWLSNRALCSLYGIRRVVEKLRVDPAKIKMLDISCNRLKMLDVAHLLDCFPSLRNIDAKFNCIEQLIMPKQLPASFTLELDGNLLTNLPAFVCGKENSINLNKNCFSASNIQKCNRVHQPPLRVKVPYWLSPLYEREFWEEVRRASIPIEDKNAQDTKKDLNLFIVAIYAGMLCYDAYVFCREYKKSLDRHTKPQSPLQFGDTQELKFAKQQDIKNTISVLLPGCLPQKPQFASTKFHYQSISPKI